MQLPLVLLSLLLFGYAVRQAIRQRHLRRAGVRTTGVVSHVLTSQTHHPVVRFVDEQRRGHEFLIRFFRAGSLPVGDRVPVVYLPGEPASARIALASQRTLAVGGPGLVGVLLAATAVAEMCR
ncbi:DUF3592 domain-containing protein [Streptomyces sp. NPDC059740]|uniref:DUF3592 domain-containing protein n=1 Tax=Streptomyces sp. NPDC059740 TaxID=3346926 RepID=UPI00364D3B27